MRTGRSTGADATRESGRAALMHSFVKTAERRWAAAGCARDAACHHTRRITVTTHLEMRSRLQSRRKPQKSHSVACC